MVTRNINIAIYFFSLAAEKSILMQNIFLVKYILKVNGFLNQIQQNIGIAILYIEEAIQQANDKVSMYNLSHIYIYHDNNTKRIDKSIELLIRSCLQGFNPSIMLLKNTA